MVQKKVKDFPEYAETSRKFFEERYDATGNLVYKVEILPDEGDNYLMKESDDLESQQVVEPLVLPKVVTK